VWDPIVYAITECTSTMVYIWPDDGSMSRNMSPNFLLLILITNICYVIDEINLQYIYIYIYIYIERERERGPRVA
jgi:hypothetical protein